MEAAAVRAFLGAADAKRLAAVYQVMEAVRLGPEGSTGMKTTIEALQSGTGTLGSSARTEAVNVATSTSKRLSQSTRLRGR